MVHRPTEHHNQTHITNSQLNFLFVSKAMHTFRWNYCLSAILNMDHYSQVPAACGRQTIVSSFLTQHKNQHLMWAAVLCGFLQVSS